jgi:hypothetical protein
MNNLALTFENQGRWEEAEQLQVQVMETSKTKLGADHHNTLTSMANLAFTWESTGRHAEAIDLLKICVAKQQKILGPAHPQAVFISKTLLKWTIKRYAYRGMICLLLLVYLVRLTTFW